MGVLTGIVTVPLGPVRGVVWLARTLQQEAERELYDRGRLIRQLEELEDARAAGEISAAEAEQIEDMLIRRLTAGPALGE